MKDNLKTLVPCGCSHCRDWKKRFEKELREINEKTTEDYNIENAKGWGKDSGQLSFLSGKYRTYLEILGEKK